MLSSSSFPHLNLATIFFFFSALLSLSVKYLGNPTARNSLYRLSYLNSCILLNYHYSYIYIHFSLSFPSLCWFLPHFSSLLLSLLFHFSDNTFSFLLPILPSFRISLSDSHFIFSSNIAALLYVSTLSFILLVSSFAIYPGVFQSNPKIHFKYLSCTASMLFHSFHSQISVPYTDNRTFVFFYYNLFEFPLINSPNLFHCHRCLFVLIRNKIHILNC